jgi:hypothetical protein
LAVATCLCDAALAEPQDAARHEKVGPPVIKLPLDVIDPPRDVAAAGWISAYCAKWDDGCTVCERQMAAEQPHCKPEQESAQNECDRRAIVCFRALDEMYFNRICSEFSFDRLVRGRSGALYAIALGQFNHWRLTERGWTLLRPPEEKPGEIIVDITNGSVPVAVTSRGYVPYGYQPYYDDDQPAKEAFGAESTGIRCLRSYDGVVK